MTYIPEDAVLPKRWDSFEDHQLAQLRYKLQLAEYEASDYRRLARELEQKLQRERASHELTGRAAETLAAVTGGCAVTFERQGQFTIALVVDPVAERPFVGATCCGVKDTFNQTIGEAIALGRAMAARGEYYADEAFDRS